MQNMEILDAVKCRGSRVCVRKDTSAVDGKPVGVKVGDSERSI